MAIPGAPGRHRSEGRQWSVGLMDVLGQVGDPDRPSKMLELEYASGRYFTLV